MQWKKDMILGLNELDKKTEDTISRINESLRMIQANRGTGNIKVFADEIRMHLVDLFTYQETMMTLSDYNRYFQHKVAHKQFLDKFSDEVDGYMSDPFSYSINYLDIMLSNWFIRHFLLDDKEFARFYKNKHKLNDR